LYARRSIFQEYQENRGSVGRLRCFTKVASFHLRSETSEFRKFQENLDLSSPNKRSADNIAFGAGGLSCGKRMHSSTRTQETVDMTTISEAAAARIAVDAFTEGLVAALTAKNIEVKGDELRAIVSDYVATPDRGEYQGLKAALREHLAATA
jgi:hypothetical protein